MSLLGVDIGTTGCKAAAFGLDGRPLATAYREYAFASPRPGWCELDSALVWRLVREAIAEAAAATRADPVTAVGISSMGEAATPVTASGEILGGAILSSDIRGGEYVDKLRETIGQEAFYATNPNILGVNYTMPKLCWLRDHEPRLYARAERFLLWADLAAFLLGGEAATCHSLANRTLLFDIRREDWSDRLIDLAGLHREKLAPCAPAGAVAGALGRRIAEELGLPPAAAIVTGGHDQCCNALGAGLVAPGGAVCGIGTYECITPVFDRIPDAPAMLAAGLNVEHHVLKGLYVSFLYNQAGSLVRWFRDTFAAADRGLAAPGEDLYEALGREMPEGPTRLLTLPHFEVTGPPHFAADSAGVILGLRTSTTRGEILKSIMESVTFYFVEGLQALRRMGIDASRFIATGGGARSDRWLQIKADILGVPFIRPRVTESAALGAAILAGLATGALESPAAAAERFVRPERTFQPDPARHRLYRQRLEKYRRLDPLLRPFLASAFA